MADLVPAPISGENKAEAQRRKDEEERIENRRIVEGINDDEDLDYYSALDFIYQDYVFVKITNVLPIRYL